MLLLTFFNALEQFDVIQVFYFCLYSGISNVSLAMIYSMLVLSFYLFKMDNSFFISKDVIFRTMFFLFIYKTVKENLNIKKIVYFNFISFVFLFVLFGNICGLIPYYLTTTSYLIVTFFLSCSCFIGLNIVGIRLHGQKMLCLFVPEGTPFILIPFLILIEIISYFARVASLAIRLFANMMAGHTLLKILSGFLWALLSGMTIWVMWTLFPLAIILVVSVLEIMIAFLQSFVYLILVSIYINDVIRLH